MRTSVIRGMGQQFVVSAISQLPEGQFLICLCRKREFKPLTTRKQRWERSDRYLPGDDLDMFSHITYRNPGSTVDIAMSPSEMSAAGIFVGCEVEIHLRVAGVYKR